MKKRLFSLPLSVLLGLIPTLCAARQTSTSVPTVDPYAECALSSKETISSRGVWDVTDVDISAVNPKRKLIALTFDDSPAGTLERIVSVFVHFNAQHPDCPAAATLFCNGKHINDYTRSALQTAFAAQFEIGNHTQHHYRLTELSLSAVQKEIQRTDELLQSIDGKRLHLLRAPYGEVNDTVKRAAKTPIIDWLIDTKDWTGASVEQIQQTILSKKANGAIVLMHDGYDNTVLALKQLLPDLYENGYQAVTVSQMAKAHGCTLNVGGVYIRARKPMAKISHS